MKALREPLWWLIALFIGLLAGLPYSAPLFSRLFPELPRPVYQQESFWALTLDHGWLVVASSLAATAIGLGAGVAVTRPAGSAFRPLVETIAAIGQTFPPVAVLAMAVPVLGFGWLPALIALALYGILPVLQGTLIFWQPSRLVKKSLPGSREWVWKSVWPGSLSWACTAAVQPKPT